MLNQARRQILKKVWIDQVNHKYILLDRSTFRYRLSSKVFGIYLGRLGLLVLAK